MAVAGHSLGLCYSNSTASRFRSTKTNAGISSSREKSRKRMFSLNINAAFWGSGQGKRLVEAPGRDFVLSTEHIMESVTEGKPIVQETYRKISISVVSSISQLSSEDWDACSMGATGQNKINPFLTHAFLSCLEETGCAVEHDIFGFNIKLFAFWVTHVTCQRGASFGVLVETGWLPQHIIARDEDGALLGVVPLYIKSHSYGEFVFDHSWADAYYNFGSSYYPKLQCSVPFTPVTGQRILVRDSKYKDQIFEKLVIAMKQLTEKFQMSSLHITFPTEKEWDKLYQFGFLQRIGMQYHWKNRDYKSFDDFLMDLKQSKRKTIRQERKKILSQNLRMKRLRGSEIKAHHWDCFYRFYRNTTDNKWGRAFLTREFFHMLGSKLGDRVLLVVAEDGENLVAGALNLIGSDTLFGRLWGCLPEVYYPNLHFEACYYQAIEAAIEWNLSKVEAGAQGEHKIQRGYMPVTTYSCHYICDNAFKEAIGDFLARETPQVKLVIQLLADSGPYKDGLF